MSTLAERIAEIATTTVVISGVTYTLVDENQGQGSTHVIGVNADDIEIAFWYVGEEPTAQARLISMRLVSDWQLQSPLRGDWKEAEDLVRRLLAAGLKGEGTCPNCGQLLLPERAS